MESQAGEPPMQRQGQTERGSGDEVSSAPRQCVSSSESGQPAVAESPARSLLIDAVRGMAISLVALGHTNQGIIHRHWWGSSPVGTRLDEAIYSFHMPAFFLMSGIFLRASAKRRGARRFTIERLRTIMYPYFVWSILIALSVIPLSRFVVQKTPGIAAFLHDLFMGAGIWFLPTLFLCLMLGMLLRRLHGAIILAIGILLFLLHPTTGIICVDLMFQFFPFLAAGMWLGRRFEWLDRVPRTMAFAAGILLCVLVVVYTGRYSRWPDGAFLGLGFAGTLMLMLVARGMAHSRATRALAWVGEASLAVYLVGAYGQGALRQALEWMHVTEPYTQLILPTLLAIAMPAWLYQNRERLHIGWLFVAPFWQQRPPRESRTARN
jgi:fucose 4-O-acetylase-like acetyltransferase